jgi:SAM-dependent methyltransferase
MTVNAASRWSSADYAEHGAFVPALGDAALGLLSAKPGEFIIDIGCGDGTLTRRIADAGARVIGLDSSEEMVEAARAKGVDAFVADAETLGLEGQAARFGQFDAAFSNAALHWMLDADAVAGGVFGLLRPGGRFAGEMGGEGNLAILRSGLRAELAERGFAQPETDAAWYPGIDEFVRLYACAGFTEIVAVLVARPTPLAGGLGPWIRTFRAGWLDLAMVPEWARDDIAAGVERRVADLLRQPDGSWNADYVRLRFAMKKPEA